jgi:hypothetical protein
LIEAWASHKSFRPKDGGEPPSGNGREVDFHREKRSNETHRSTTDPDARLYKKSKGSEAKMSYLGHALMENRHGLLVDTMVTIADGTAERDAAVLMASQISGVKQVTLGGDKNYDTEELVRDLREMKVTPQKRNRGIVRILLYNPDNGVTRNFMPHLWMFLLQALTPWP